MANNVCRNGWVLLLSCMLACAATAQETPPPTDAAIKSPAPAASDNQADQARATAGPAVDTSAAQPSAQAADSATSSAPDTGSDTGSDTVSDTTTGTAAAAGTDTNTGTDSTADSNSDSTTDSSDVQQSSEPQFKSLDQEVQGLKKETLDLNRELFSLEEDLLYPANTQVAIFVSMDVGKFFNLDSVSIKLDNKEVANYLYTEREAQALLKGGVQRVYIGNLKVGKHELVAFFTGKGPNGRDYKRGTSEEFEKGVGYKYFELKISDKKVKEQPEFIVKEWE